MTLRKANTNWARRRSGGSRRRPVHGVIRHRGPIVRRHQEGVRLPTRRTLRSLVVDFGHRHGYPSTHPHARQAVRIGGGARTVTPASWARPVRSLAETPRVPRELGIRPIPSSFPGESNSLTYLLPVLCRNRLRYADRHAPQGWASSGRSPSSRAPEKTRSLPLGPGKNGMTR